MTATVQTPATAVSAVWEGVVSERRYQGSCSRQRGLTRLFRLPGRGFRGLGKAAAGLGINPAGFTIHRPPAAAAARLNGLKPLDAGRAELAGQRLHLGRAEKRRERLGAGGANVG